jgi:alpha/beta superfamily hydrolase
VTSLRIGAPPRLLEGVLTEPDGPPCGVAVVCHPHPQMGGDMDNPVVLTAADALLGEGFVVVRFNFGGVGRSGGSYSGGPAETDDVGHALAVATSRGPGGVPVLLAGYSFGAWAALRAVHAGAVVDRVLAVAPPLAFLDWDFLPGVEVSVDVIVGERDQYCPPARLAAAMSPTRRVETIAGADHFFAGSEARLADAVARAGRGIRTPS